MSDWISLFDATTIYAEEKFMSPAHVSALGEIGRGRFFFQQFPQSVMAQAILTTVQGKTTLSLLIRLS